MVHAKNYETASTFVSYSEKTIGFFFSRHGVVWPPAYQQRLSDV